MTHVTKTRRARLDLDEIWYYIALDNPTAADKLLDQIGNTIQTIAENPKIGRPRPELNENIFSFPIKRYVIFYHTTENGIQIVRILHSARDSMLIAEDGGFNA